jgi:hypothetical protein
MRRREQKPLFYKPVQEGVLYEVASLAWQSYFDADRVEADLDPEYAVWHLADLLEFLAHHQIEPSADTIQIAAPLIIEANETFARDDVEYYDWLKYDGPRAYRGLASLLRDHEHQLLALEHQYALSLAERLFHDRALCAYLNNLVFDIGIDGGLAEPDDKPTQWVERCTWPAWVRQTVLARDRGACADCGAQVSLELQAKGELDHMRPLGLGGTNDVSNLQLLCERCNRTKAKKLTHIRSSIPPYLCKGRRARA